jgi:hypothetical protein
MRRRLMMMMFDLMKLSSGPQTPRRLAKPSFQNKHLVPKMRKARVYLPIKPLHPQNLGYTYFKAYLLYSCPVPIAKINITKKAITEK